MQLKDDLAGIDVSECIMYLKKSHVPCYTTLSVIPTDPQHV